MSCHSDGRGDTVGDVEIADGAELGAEVAGEGRRAGIDTQHARQVVDAVDVRVAVHAHVEPLVGAEMPLDCISH